MSIFRTSCPHCKTVGSAEVTPTYRRVGAVPLLLGGIILPLLWFYGRVTDYRCKKCYGEYSSRRGLAWLSLTAFWLLVALIVLFALFYESS